MIRAKTIEVVETAAGIPVDVDIEAKATGSITRDGQEIEQKLAKPTTDQLVVGVRLLHLGDLNVYEITNRTGSTFQIKRINDETQHDATLKQLKLCTYLLTEHSGQRTP